MLALHRLVRRPVEHGLAFRFGPHGDSTKSSPPQLDGSESKIVSESVHGCPHEREKMPVVSREPWQQAGARRNEDLPVPEAARMALGEKEFSQAPLRLHDRRGLKRWNQA